MAGLKGDTSTSSGPDRRWATPRLGFAAGSLRKGGGGIAELSRQVFKTLLELHREQRIELELHVLEESGPAEDDELFDREDLPFMHWYAGSRWKFSSALLRSRADLVLYDHVGLARMQGMLPAALARPYLLLIHSVEIWNNNRSDYHRTARNARLLIANSEYTARKARRHYPDLPEIAVCWPGKDQVESGYSNRDGAYESLGPHAMLIVGRLDAEQRHKGHDHLIEAMPLVLEQVPDAQLVIAGGGSDRDRLESKSKALDVSDSILFTGRVEEPQLQELYTQCALFVMPSDGDGFGLVFLEAMMNRLPCVGLVQGAAAEIFEQGKSGKLVNRDDLVGMANDLSSLLLDGARRTELGEAGYERYQTCFTGQHHSARLRSVLMEQLEINNAPR
ncbi:glycosyltransferase family 4 protein [Pseudomonadota bacterium]